ncbi:prefoldin subunit 2 [Lepeophtheirus salmonis]|uniref:Prefoldin subunit 2 n=1 Tax=Lepeophtheirus salmonis TaxID=72036 RepID=C1BSY2_LEPSM|nr:prefoldin subunit 2-like [Lepeophtheirus salmonis]ACO12135.1 Prefoldin subunit 2 [Lepeophtheirus salmonis]ADD24211.1 Prefoldin subunit 2 [Lepeophtheirus salmonis]ADD38870.1 Prefoldin subunit 2 [Lepeophtheirus salmonis]
MAGMMMKPNAKQEEILNGFNLLRNEQRTLANKVSELTTDLNEHKLVLETLNQVEKDRRCFRMVGGVLVERNVGNVVPALKSNSEKMDKLIETLTKQLTEKGQEIQGYMAKHNIRIQGAPEEKKQGKAASEESSKATSGVLVESNN